VVCALWHSADKSERNGLNYLDVDLSGLTDYFDEHGLERVGRDGLDERLHWRYRCDPAEFVTVLGGGSDGLHYGLWYEDPAELPALIAHNYARDSAETWTNGYATLIAELRWRVRRVASDYGEDGPEAEQVRPVGAALDWFAAADEAALRADGLSSTPDQRPYSAVGLFPILPTGAGDPRLAESRERLKGFRTATAAIAKAAKDSTDADAAEAARVAEAAAAGSIAQAEQELAAGAPALALAVGAELHWLDADRYRETSRDLLISAYRALGRHALADIIEVHIANRDLRSVRVLG
jgi:hypothetical protein